MERNNKIHYSNETFYQSHYMGLPETLDIKKKQENQAVPINLSFGSLPTGIKVPANEKKIHSNEK